MVGYAGTLSIKESRIYTQYYILYSVYMYYDSIPKGSRYLHRYSTPRYARKEASDVHLPTYSLSLPERRRREKSRANCQENHRTL